MEYIELTDGVANVCFLVNNEEKLRIETDAIFAQECFESAISAGEGVLLDPNNENEVQNMEKSQTSSSSLVQGMEDSQMSLSAVSNFKWSTPSIKLFLEELRKSGFGQAGIVQKRRIYPKVAAVMKEYGYDVDPEILSKKYSNLLHTYKRLKDKSKMSGEGSIKWEFFSIMEDLLHKLKSCEPPPSALFSVGMAPFTSRGPSSVPSSHKPSLVPGPSSPGPSSAPDPSFIPRAGPSSAPDPSFIPRPRPSSAPGPSLLHRPSSAPSYSTPVPTSMPSTKKLLSNAGEEELPKKRKVLISKKTKGIEQTKTEELLQKFYEAKKEEGEQQKIQGAKYKRQLLSVLRVMSRSLRNQTEHMKNIEKHLKVISKCSRKSMKK